MRTLFFNLKLLHICNGNECLSRSKENGVTINFDWDIVDKRVTHLAIVPNFLISSHIEAFHFKIFWSFPACTASLVNEILDSLNTLGNLFCSLRIRNQVQSILDLHIKILLIWVHIQEQRIGNSFVIRVTRLLVNPFILLPDNFELIKLLSHCSVLLDLFKVNLLCRFLLDWCFHLLPAKSNFFFAGVCLIADLTEFKVEIILGIFTFTLIVFFLGLIILFVSFVFNLLYELVNIFINNFFFTF